MIFQLQKEKHKMYSDMNLPIKLAKILSQLNSGQYPGPSFYVLTNRTIIEESYLM